MNDHDLVRQLAGWRQTTAEILYRMPDHPGLVQTFLWQDMDRWDDDPRLTYPAAAVLRLVERKPRRTDRASTGRCCAGDHSRRITPCRRGVAAPLRQAGPLPSTGLAAAGALPGPHRFRPAAFMTARFRQADGERPPINWVTRDNRHYRA